MKQIPPLCSRSVAFAVGFALVSACAVTVCAGSSERVKELIADIQAGPAVYRTSAAVEYLSRTAGIAAQPPTPERVDRAKTALQATVTLGELGVKASDAVGVLVQRFPRAVHVSTAYENYHAGDGSFEDWVMTKVMGEKNKFLFSAPFLGYESLSKCNAFLEVEHETTRAGEQYDGAGRLLNASVTFHVTFTFYAGACALSMITGQPHGKDIEAWRRWWQMNGADGYTQPTPSSSPRSSRRNPKNVSELVVGGTYRFTLTTGDMFTGAVESKTDTSVIIDATDGNAYTFRTNLIRRCEVVSLPKSKGKKTGASGPEVLSFGELRKRSPIGKKLEVRIKSGQTFKGALASIDEENLTLNVDGSSIPIHKDVVAQVRTVVPKPKEPAEKKRVTPKRTGPRDTVVVVNPKTDNYGKPLPSLVYVGTITKETDAKITLEREDGATVVVKRDEIKRISKHSGAGSSSLEPIKRYAKPLECPKDMVLVDLPPAPGVDRPFFKMCIDMYEYPNKQGATPKSDVSFQEAKKLCESQGKRLCRAAEWEWACSGFDALPYPYGEAFNKNTCNTDGRKGAMTSGGRPKCVSQFGLHDMTGNVFEWVINDKGDPLLMGGPSSKCQTRSPGFEGEAKPLAGVRCCKSN